MVLATGRRSPAAPQALERTTPTIPAAVAAHLLHVDGEVRGQVFPIPTDHGFYSLSQLLAMLAPNRTLHSRRDSHVCFCYFNACCNATFPSGRSPTRRCRKSRGWVGAPTSRWTLHLLVFARCEGLMAFDASSVCWRAGRSQPKPANLSLR